MSNEHFNLIAGFYNKAAIYNLGDSLLQALELPVDGILLDAGGGTGRVAERLRHLCASVVVVDVSLGMMKYAVEKGLDCIYSPVESLPFASESIDRIIMLDALHHVHDQEKATADLFRLLKPGGILVLIEPNILKFGVKLIALGEKLLLMRSRFLNGDDIASLFSDQDCSLRTEYLEHNVWIIVKKNDKQM